MSIIKLPNIVYPLQHLDKTNEIIQVLNDNLNMNYSESNPALTSVDGVCTWTVTHNLATENVNYSIYEGSNAIITDVSITSENALTVTFNSASNIAKDTYPIVVMANGSGASAGSITEVDSELSTTSFNPVQNRVITNYVKPKLDNYIPRNTVINVKLDGTGDFTTLESAISYLTGKWSNGAVAIQLGAGTFTGSSAIIIDTFNFNFTRLVIYGQGVTNTTIVRNSIQDWSGAITVTSVGTPVIIKELSIEVGTNSPNARVLQANQGAKVEAANCSLSNGRAGIMGYDRGNITCSGTTIYISNCPVGIAVQQASCSMRNSNLVLSDISSFVLDCMEGSNIIIHGCTKTSTNVAAWSAQEVNKFLGMNGYICSNLT